MRCPAWCDRILWRAPEGYVEQHTYGDCPALVHSDHRPVGTRFTVRTDAHERLSPATAAAARQGLERLDLFLASLGHTPAATAAGAAGASGKSGSNSSSSISSAATAAAATTTTAADEEASVSPVDDELNREGELKFFARNVSLVVLRFVWYCYCCFGTTGDMFLLSSSSPLTLLRTRWQTAPVRTSKVYSPSSRVEEPA
jgi:hypothetical protein